MGGWEIAHLRMDTDFGGFNPDPGVGRVRDFDLCPHLCHRGREGWPAIDDGVLPEQDDLAGRRAKRHGR
jgi:hypothetical protein